jgi:hypothetical protein
VSNAKLGWGIFVRHDEYFFAVEAFFCATAGTETATISRTASKFIVLIK